MTSSPTSDLPADEHQSNHQSNRNRESLLRRIIYWIRQSLELEEILATTAAEVRSFLGTDRIMIYRFNPDNSGQVVAEAINAQRLPSLLGLNFPADDIPPHARQLFIESRVRSIVDVESGKIGQSLSCSLETGEVLEGEFHYRPLDPCHAEYLTAMGVKSSLVVPIFHYDRLWGLLVSHHTESKVIPEDALQAVQLVVDQLSVAIAQSVLLAQAQEKAERETTINRVGSLLHSLSTIELQKALEETVTALQGSGGRLFIATDGFNLPIHINGAATDCPYRVYLCGTQPLFPEQAKLQLMEQYSVWQEHFRTAKANQPWAIPDLYQVSALRNLQSAFKSTSIRSLLIVPLQVREQWAGYLSIFRDEVEVETLWAGQFDPDERQRYPRTSFEAWREAKSGQVRQWTNGDVQLVQALGQQFASAIEQHELYQQVQILNVNLESQVQERTAKLQQATEQQRILFEVVAEMRKSLDLNTIFTTVTRSVREVLKVDRVGIYRFDPDSDFSVGEFVAEDVSEEVPSALATQIRDHCFGTRYATKYRQGRICAIDDIHHANLQDCHIAVLDQFYVKAMIVVPLMKGDDLWGLFCIHQCAFSRAWETAEIQFAAQIADQLGVALEQANLLSQTQQQATQLAQTLQDLKNAQTQLIQTEKMSSLGQLVAGVAHEINNPVNFIYGNLSHISGYAEDLLSLVQLYQKYYPHPDTEIQGRSEEIDLEFLAEDLPRTLSSMKMGTDRIRQIVLSLRNFSRLDQAEVKSVNIHEGIDSTLLILQHRLKSRPDSPGIELIKEYGNLPEILCYAGQLNQVFMNLLSNAIDSLEEWNMKRSFQEIKANPATIRIQTQQLDNQWISIQIADNGKGMTEEVRYHLFDPFFTTKPVGKGTGLGLSISYQIITEKHGGRLKCVSAPGQGAIFIIEIPIKPPAMV